MNGREQNQLRYMRPLDGIRAVAILAVIIFHVTPGRLRGGFTGVDVFFVLSGFLIATIILHDLREGSFSIGEFYLRRVQRLVPNIVVTVLAVLLLWTFLLPPGLAMQPARHGLWTLFDLSNVYVGRNLGSYWGDDAAWAPLTHTWSLAIEEQFYLLFPVSLALLARYQAGRMGLWLSIAAAVSFGICLYRTHSHPESTFYYLPTRVWELLLGAILAAYRTPLHVEGTSLASYLRGKTQEAVGWIGIGMMIVGFVTIDEQKGFPGVATLVPTLGTALVLLTVVDGETQLARWLSAPLMVGTGKLSYSLYLWHWPLITLGRLEADLYGLPQRAAILAGCLAGVLLGCVAYVGVERPLRRRGSGRAWRLATIAVGFSVVVISCGVIVARRPVADPDHRFATSEFHGKLFDAGRAAQTSSPTAVRWYDVFFPPVPSRPNDAWRTGGIVHLYGGGLPKIVVLGSSHALMYSRLIDDICRAMNLSVAFLGVDDGTPAFFESSANSNFSSQNDAHEFDETRRKWLREWRPVAVFAIDRWDSHVGKPPGFAVKLDAFLREVSPLAGRIIFVTQVPVARLGEKVNLRGFITWRMSLGKGRPRLDPDTNERMRQEAAATAEAATGRFPNLRMLKADRAFYEEDGSIQYAKGKIFFYADDDHLTDQGAEVVRGLFQSAITEAIESSAPKS